MIALELDSILNYLTDQGVQAQLQAETNQLVIVFKVEEREFPLFIRIFDGAELLQLLAFIPCEMKKSAVNDVSRLLHILNKELDVPGFGLDEDTSVIFYRSMIPIHDKSIDETLLNAYLNTIQLVCKSFSSVIASVAYGTVTFDEILKKTRKNKQQSFAQALLRS